MIKIPVSFVLEMDDIGWDNGRDLRLSGKASRSGLPRNHALEDYQFLNRLSEATGKKLVGALVLADWDKDNILRGEVGITHDPYGWDRKNEIDLEKFSAYRDTLNEGKVDIFVHGILHGRYAEDGALITEWEYTPYDKLTDKSMEFRFSEDDFRRRLDLYFKIYNSWGFNQKIRGIIFPGGIRGGEEIRLRVCKVLKEYGITYWSERFDFPETIRITDGVACFKWGMNGNVIPWNAYDFDPSELGNFYIDGSDKNSCLRGSHWTNYLRFNPKKNFENIRVWEEYYNRQSEVFGSHLANNIDDGVNQLVHYEFAKIINTANGYDIDLSAVTNAGFPLFRREFLISLTKDEEPLSCIGGDIVLYEEKRGFNTYKITYDNSVINLETKN